MASVSAHFAMMMVAEQIQPALLSFAEDKQPQRCWDTIIKALERYPSLMWTQRVPPNQVGGHKKNRKGMGYSVGTAMMLGGKHVKVGYSYTKACAGNFGIHVTSEYAAASLAWNNTKSETQGLPPMASIFLEPIGGTHSNLFLRAVHAGIACDNITLAPQGTLDYDHIRLMSADLAKALDGLEWNVINPKVFERWPQILEIGMDVLNIRGSSDVSEHEGLLGIREAYKSYGGTDPEAAWNAAVESVVRVDPHWSGWAKSIMEFAKTVTDEQLQETTEMKSACIKTPLGVGANHGFCGGAYLSKVGTMNFPSTELKHYPAIRMACYHAQILSPISKTIDGKYSHMSTTDVLKLTVKSMLGKVDAANKLMSQARSKMQERIEENAALGANAKKVPKRTTMQAVFYNDCRLIYYLTGKGKGSKFDKEWKSLEDAYADFETDMKDIFDIADVDGAAAPQAPKPSVALPTAAQLDSFAHQLQMRKGMKVGATIVHNDNVNDVWEIVAIDDKHTELKLTGYRQEYLTENKCKKNVKNEVLAEEWKTVKIVVNPRKLDFGNMMPDMSIDLPIAAQKAKIVLAINELYESMKDMQGPMSVAIWEHPMTVCAKKKYAARELKLVPATYNILSQRQAFDAAASAKVAVGSFDLTVAGEKVDVSFGLCPMFNTKFHDDATKNRLWVAPYWQVPTDAKNKHYNMVISHVVTQGIKIPVMTNNRVLNIGDKLLLWNYKPAPADADSSANKKQKKS